jgi:hypothetical protein
MRIQTEGTKATMFNKFNLFKTIAGSLAALNGLNPTIKLTPSRRRRTSLGRCAAGTAA